MSDASIAQRICDGFHWQLKRAESHDDDAFKEFVKSLGRYQWVKSPADMEDEEMLKALYFCSQGITRVLLDVFIVCQVLAIDSGQEQISPDAILTTYKEHFKLVHASMNALRTGDEDALRKFEGMFPKAYLELVRTGQAGKVIRALKAASADGRFPGSRRPYRRLR